MGLGSWIRGKARELVLRLVSDELDRLRRRIDELADYVRSVDGRIDGLVEEVRRRRWIKPQVLVVQIRLVCRETPQARQVIDGVGVARVGDTLRVVFRPHRATVARNVINYLRARYGCRVIGSEVYARWVT